MKSKISIMERIRGWFPRDPAITTRIPQQKFESATYPPPPPRPYFYAIPDHTIIQNAWYLKGAGYVAIMVGLIGALESYFLYHQETLLLSFEKISADNPVFTDLPVWIAAFALLALSGAIAALIGFLVDKNQGVREFFYAVKPYRDRGNTLFRLGLAASLTALLWLSNYLVNGYYLTLWSTVVFAGVGVCSLIVSIVLLRRR